MAQALTLPNPRDGLDRAVALLSARGRSASACSGLPRRSRWAVRPIRRPSCPTGCRPRRPAPPPLLVRQIAPEQALQVNQTIPIAAGPNPAARPFAFTGNAAARSRALECLASAVYYEAGRPG